MQDGGDLEAQLACKEREWKELQALRTQQLESALAEATGELSDQRERFVRLRNDFRYNLDVLEERDRELERYDAMAARVQTEDGARQAELSDLRIELAKLQDLLAEVNRQKEGLQAQYHKRGVEHRLQLERVQSGKEKDIQTLREENETLRRDLQRRIQETDGELALQKQEMMADFDGEMRKREHEFNMRMDEMRNLVLSHELKVQLLNKELDIHSKAGRETAEALQLSEGLCQQAKKEILHQNWELKNTIAVKDSRLKELEAGLNEMEAKRRKEQDAGNKKHAELERRAREREAALEVMKEAHGVDIREERTRTSRLQMQLDGLTLELEKKQESHADDLGYRELQIQELHAQLETTQAGWDAYITQVSKETVAKDTELLSVKDKEGTVRAELQKCKEDLEMYKERLASGVQREQALEQKRVQLELDWERRCEDVRAEHYLKCEELIKGLTQSREQVHAELKEKERESQMAVELLKSLTIERDRALRAAKLASNSSFQAAELDGGGFLSEEIQRLQQQNSRLQEVIAEMRKQMESISKELPRPQTPAKNQPGVTEYNQALEEELQNLKAKCRSLEDQLKQTLKTTSPVFTSAPGHPVAPDNAYLQNHIRSLNETIGGLRAEKVASAAALKKQEVRLAHLESIVNQLSQQCHSRLMENESLRLEVANQKRRASAEVECLKQKLTASEMQLEEARREAEEYQKGSLLHNLETVALGNQVSALKLDIASRKEPVVLEQSEMVKQVQEENLSLRQQLLGQRSGTLGDGGDARHLRSKLKQAARWISRLSRDKQQLIEMGNKLRAQLLEAGLDVIAQPSETGPEPTPSQPVPDTQPHGRLSTLEQLQYKLTTQELQYAQRDQCKNKPIIVRPHLSGSESEASNSNPWDLTTRVQPLGSKENIQVLSDRSSCPRTLLSSVGTNESLQDVWKMVERGWSPTMLTSNSEEQDGAAVSSKAEQDQGSPPVRVQGCKASVQERKKPARTTSEPVKKTKPGLKSGKIRNYNVKD